MNYLIYKATLNNKCYIGKTKNIQNRKRMHLQHFLLQKNNIETEYRNNNKFIPTDEVIINISKLFNDGKTIKEISKICNLSEMIISRILNDQGLRLSSRFKNGKRYDTRKSYHKKRKIYPDKSSIYEKKYIIDINIFN